VLRWQRVAVCSIPPRESGALSRTDGPLHRGKVPPAIDWSHNSAARSFLGGGPRQLLPPPRPRRRCRWSRSSRARPFERAARSSLLLLRLAPALGSPPSGSCGRSSRATARRACRANSAAAQPTENLLALRWWWQPPMSMSRDCERPVLLAGRRGPGGGRCAGRGRAAPRSCETGPRALVLGPARTAYSARAGRWGCSRPR